MSLCILVLWSSVFSGLFSGDHQLKNCDSCVLYVCLCVHESGCMYIITRAKSMLTQHTGYKYIFRSHTCFYTHNRHDTVGLQCTQTTMYTLSQFTRNLQCVHNAKVYTVCNAHTTFTWRAKEKWEIFLFILLVFIYFACSACMSFAWTTVFSQLFSVCVCDYALVWTNLNCIYALYLESSNYTWL